MPGWTRSSLVMARPEPATWDASPLAWRHVIRTPDEQAHRQGCSPVRLASCESSITSGQVSLVLMLGMSTALST